MARWSDEEFIVAVNESKNIGQVISYLNGSMSGSAYKTIRKHIKRLVLNTDHFDEHSRHNKRAKTLQIPFEEIFVQSSKWKLRNQVIKQRLLEENIKNDICELCEQGNTHNGIELVLQLDHINGNNKDNRLENLRIVCPNCHTQTKTWGNKKR